MNRYQLLKPLGDGAYGTVVTGVNKMTGEMVAVKKMKASFLSWDGCMKLREVRALKRLCHPNIVRLREVVKENFHLSLVFELMERDLLSLLQANAHVQVGLDELFVRDVIQQVLGGVAFMHSQGFFHRDLKPENILLRGGEVKIADFGLSREIHSNPPYTEYVSTRWYRAPEILFRLSNYSAPVDVWSVGCIMAEMISGQPLFPGNGELDMIYRVCSILGTPGKELLESLDLPATSIALELPQLESRDFRELFPNVSYNFLQVLVAMLTFDWSIRPTAEQVLSFPFFENGPYSQPMGSVPLLAATARNTPQVTVRAVPEIPVSIRSSRRKSGASLYRPSFTRQDSEPNLRKLGRTSSLSSLSTTSSCGSDFDDGSRSSSPVSSQGGDIAMDQFHLSAFSSPTPTSSISPSQSLSSSVAHPGPGQCLADLAWDDNAQVPSEVPSERISVSEPTFPFPPHAIAKTQRMKSSQGTGDLVIGPLRQKKRSTKRKTAFQSSVSWNSVQLPDTLVLNSIRSSSGGNRGAQSQPPVVDSPIVQNPFNDNPFDPIIVSSSSSRRSSSSVLSTSSSSSPLHTQHPRSRSLSGGASSSSHSRNGGHSGQSTLPFAASSLSKYLLNPTGEEATEVEYVHHNIPLESRLSNMEGNESQTSNRESASSSKMPPTFVSIVSRDQNNRSPPPRIFAP